MCSPKAATSAAAVGLAAPAKAPSSAELVHEERPHSSSRCPVVVASWSSPLLLAPAGLRLLCAGAAPLQQVEIEAGPRSLPYPSQGAARTFTCDARLRRSFSQPKVRARAQHVSAAQRVPRLLDI